MIEEELIKLDNNLHRLNNPILDNLGAKEAVNKDEIVNHLEAIGLNYLEDFFYLYFWREGVDPSKFTVENKIFSFGNYPTFITSSSLYLLDKNTSNIFKNRFFPLFYFTGLGEDPILIDLGKDPYSFGQIYMFSPSITLSKEPVSIYDSLKTCIATINLCYENGVYSINSHGNLEVDTEQEFMIAKELNPNSEFWES